VTERITTPASSERRPTVAVLGAGIAGLTAAHELAERGFEVTVYEPRADERNGLGPEPSGFFPPVKLGGLAASQYSTVGVRDGSPAELRPFPGRRGQPPMPGRSVAGEHGFRFFPAYYLHTWDLFQRIPTYEPMVSASGAVTWQATSRTVMDNVKRVITQGTTVEGQASLVFPREAPRTPIELISTVGQLMKLGFTQNDISTFLSRVLRYLVTSPLRRARELQNLSAYDFFVGRDNTAGTRRFSYSSHFDKYLLEMPRVLAAFDSRWGDARTNLTTYLQLQLQMDRRDNKADGVLNGPTTESWLDHWYHHLVALGVRFVRGAAERIDPPDKSVGLPPHLKPRVRVTLADGTLVTPDYAVVAVDAPAAERITAPMRAVGTGGTVAGLDGFTTSIPPPNGPLEPGATRPKARRNPYAMDEMGVVPWDRFQTLAGIQFFFDTEFQLLRGHMYHSGSEWGLSSINQHGMWEQRPSLVRDGHVAVLSVDIGDFNTPSRHLVDEHGRGRAARDCTADEIAAEVWRQITVAITSGAGNVAEALLPWPSWYALDQGLVMACGPGQGGGPAVRNETPYLVPIVGDWNNRPGTEPWNPHNTSLRAIPTEDRWLEDLEHRDVWQARHGGYQVHNNSVVFAGTWTKTFTRMTSMEAAGESARHAVNAILDHYVWVGSRGLDRRETTSLAWQFPFGFLDQGYSSPIRMPSPAGDYCYVFDIENREPADTRLLRYVDSNYCANSLPHPLDSPAAGSLTSSVPPSAGGQSMTSPLESNQQLLAYLQVWRQLLEQMANLTAGLPSPNASCAPPGFPAMPAMPPGIPFMPAMPPGMPFIPPVGTNPPMPQAFPFMPPVPNSPAPPSPTDYTQQLFGYLQAWRQYLEQASDTAAPSPSPPHPGTSNSQSSVQPPSTEPTQPTGQSAPAEQPNSALKIPPNAMSAAINQLGNQRPFENSLHDESLLENPHLNRPFNEVGTKSFIGRSLYKRESNAVVAQQVTTPASAAAARPAAEDATDVSAAPNAQLMQALNEGATAHVNTDSLLGRVGMNQASNAPSDTMVFLPGMPGGTQITDLPFAGGVGRDAAPPAVVAPRRAAQPPPAQTPRTAFSGLAGRVNAPRAVPREAGQGPAR
jgi:hypothetical protein